MAYDRWLSVYPYMVVPTNGAKKPLLKMITFDKYYKQIKNPNKTETRTDEEILERMEKVIQFNQGKNKANRSE